MSFSDRLEKILIPLPNEFLGAGLSYVGSSDDTQSDGSKFKNFSFVNKSSQISVQISVSEKNGSITVFISHPSRGGFSLHEYFVHQKRKQEYDTLYFPASVENYLDMLRSLISGEWHDIIIGDRWEVIPFDWMGYK